MKKARILRKPKLRTNNTRRLLMLKRNHKKILQRRREFIRTELAEQWPVAC
ncbi:hypothetical protein [Alteromonas oceanisediminis]|uniref:hypothetical protein n=1 Tax=Alteromonas oceanisediminis TaxID=2836180 RepID=UPI001BDB2A97|nr:hypothetical protein [Alteromonas oceanisediminis]MBT0584993.1 hypothetical protein [Alteromonas oceanisediminis]